MNERDKMFAELNRLGFSTKKLIQMKSLNVSKSTVKRKRRQLREKRFIERKLGSGRPKIIELQKGEFILNQLQKNVFLNAAKIKKLIDEYEEVKISEIIIHRFLKEKGYKWKGPLNRVKNEQEQKSARWAFSKKNWIEIWKTFSIVTSLVST